MFLQLRVCLVYFEKSLAWDAGKITIDLYWELMNHAGDEIF